MNILLLGPDNSITQTVADMLKSANGWLVEIITNFTTNGELEFKNTEKKDEYDIIVANLSGFSESPISVIKTISDRFSPIPILVLYSYGKKSLIRPLLKFGITGYLQVGISEGKLLKAVKKVSDGQQHIFTETT